MGPAFKSTVNNSYQLAQKYIDQTEKNLITDSKLIRNYVKAERLIDRDILSVDELKWLDEYHQLVFNEISPMLTNSEDLKWLIWACGLV